MILIRHDILLFLMLLALYVSGKHFARHGRILSQAGLGAIAVYALNEGLRFGRGIDYNLYWQGYMDLAKGWDTNQNIGFLLIEKVFLYFNLPFQVLVMFMSMMFILGTLFLMKQYRSVAIYALPLWCIMSRSAVENMVRWYLAFSFILIGLSYLIEKRDNYMKSFFLFSLLGSIIHYAILPIPIIYYLLSFRERPLLRPKFAVVIFILVALLFETSMMLPLVDLVNSIASLSDKFSGYGENAEFWLTNNASGSESAGLGISSTTTILFLLIFGYKYCQRAGFKYVLAYNLFTLGAIFYTIGTRIELVSRFDMVFYFFGAIVLACILKLALVDNNEFRKIVIAGSFIVILLINYGPFVGPFRSSPELRMYVWDHKGETPSTMFNAYINEKYRMNKNYESKSQRMKRYRAR